MTQRISEVLDRIEELRAKPMTPEEAAEYERLQALYRDWLQHGMSL